MCVLFVDKDHGPLNQDEYKRIQDIPDEGKLLLVYDKTSVFRKYECPPIYEKTGSRVQNLLQNPWGNGRNSDFVSSCVGFIFKGSGYPSQLA